MGKVKLEGKKPMMQRVLEIDSTLAEIKNTLALLLSNQQEIDSGMRTKLDELKQLNEIKEAKKLEEMTK